MFSYKMPAHYYEVNDPCSAIRLYDDSTLFPPPPLATTLLAAYAKQIDLPK